MDWSYVSINFSWSVLKYYNETMSSWTLMWFESMVCCVFFYWRSFFLIFCVFFVLFLFLFFWVHLVSCVCWCPTHIVLCFCFVLFVFVLYFVLPKVASFSGLSILDQYFCLSNVYLGYQIQCSWSGKYENKGWYKTQNGKRITNKKLKQQ
jgi:hypothetical protein